MDSSVRRAIVEVRWGPMASRRAVIEPGGTLRVGRTDRADLMVPQALFALLDAARSERIVEILRESVETYRCLFEGEGEGGEVLRFARGEAR